MKINETILFIIDSLGGRVSSKTKVHKLCYFYSVFSKKDLGFKPHYYGPYSPLIERTLDELEALGLIDKGVNRFGEGSVGFEIVRYDYTINSYGKQVLAALNGDADKEVLKQYISKIKEAGDPDYLDLSIAAKSHFVLQREDDPLTPEGVRIKAEAFGWNISSTDVEKAVNLLEKFKLVKRIN